MRSTLFLITLGVGLLAAGAARGQQPLSPYPAPPAVMDPAYRHFLRSPYTYKAFSALRPGYSEGSFTPFGYDTYFVEPSRLHQRITPYGFESYDTLPGYGGSSLSPWGYGSYYVPGYTQSYYLPPLVVPRR